MNDEGTSAGRRRWLRLAAGTLAALSAGALPWQAAAAEAWPSRPVKIAIAVAAGSTGDMLARMLAPRLEALWKQPVIVENKPGAGGILGTEYVVHSNDGHTLLLGSQSSLLPKFTQKGLRFDPMADLVPIYKVIDYQLLIAINGQTAKKATTLAEFVALTKSTEKGAFFAGTGPTSIFNLTLAILNRSLGIRYASVDFNNVAAMNLAVLRDDAQMVVNTPGSLKAYIDNGAIRPLAAISKERYPNLPDVPTVYEAAGYQGYLPLLWAGFFAPKGTPAAVVERIHRDVAAVLSEPALKQQIEATLTGTVRRSSPAEFAAQIREETAVWQDLLRAMNYKPE